MKSSRNSQCRSGLSDAEYRCIHKNNQGWLERNSQVRYTEDVAIDGFERIALYQHQTGNVRNLEKMALRSVREQARKVAKEEKLYVLDCEREPELEGQCPKDADPTFTTAISDLEYQALYEAITLLKPQHQDVLMLRLEDLTFGEISEKLQIPENTALSRYNRARKLLAANVKLNHATKADD